MRIARTDLERQAADDAPGILVGVSTDVDVTPKVHTKPRREQLLLPHNATARIAASTIVKTANAPQPLDVLQILRL